ncbi:MAG: FtsX-like permease family protein [Actinomycetota bacterium]
MTTVRFVLRRLVAQRLLGLAVVVTLAFTVGVLVAGPIYASGGREAIFSSTFAAAPVTVRNVRLQTFADPGFDWQNATNAVTDATSTLPRDVVVAEGRSTVRVDVGPGSFPLVFRQGAEDHLGYVEGTPPAEGQAAFSVSSAQQLGLDAGDPVTLVGPEGARQEVTVSGTYDPPAAEDPFWFGSRTPFPQGDNRAPLPLIVTPETFQGLTETLALPATYVWDVYLDFGDVPYDEAVAVEDRVNEAGQRLLAVPGLEAVRSIHGLHALLETVRQRVESLRVPIMLVVFQIGAVSLAVLAGVGSLALTRQTFELAVLHSRGFPGRTLLFAQGLQAAVSGILAFPLGLLVGLGLAAIARSSNGPQLPGFRFPVELNQTALILGAVAAVVGVLILFLLSVPAVRRTVLEERRSVSRESRPLLARVPVELFVLPVGILAFIQLQNGADASAAEDSLDPLLLAAPTLLLVGVSFLALRGLLWGLRVLDGRIGRTRSLPRYLAARRLGRSPGTSFATALLLLLSVGLAFVASSYRAISLQNYADAAHAVVGADQVLSVRAPDQMLAAARALPPNASAVVRTAPFLATASFSTPPVVLAIDPDRYAAAGWWRHDLSPTPLDEILGRLAEPPGGVELPGGPATLTVELDAPPEAAGMLLVASTEGPDGTVTVVRMPVQPGTATYDLDLGEDPARLLMIGLETTDPLDAPDEIPLGLIASVNGQPLPLDGWEPITWQSAGGDLQVAGGAATLTIRSGFGDLIGGIQPPLGPLPALVTDVAVDQLGRRFDAQIGGQAAEIVVVATAAQFPGTARGAPAIVVSAPALLERQMAIPGTPAVRINEVWAAEDDGLVARLERDGFVLEETRASAPIEGMLSQLPKSLAMGMNATAAVAALGLVAIGLSVGTYFSQRRRDYEFAALRAMGTTSRSIRGTLVIEQSTLLGFALLAGLGLGYAMLELVMPVVGTSLGVTFPPPLLVVDWSGLGIAVIVIALVTGVALALALRALLRSSVTGVLRGEAE